MDGTTALTFDPALLAVAVVCLALGGVLKGATGAGAPVIAVPALAMLVDVRFAVLAMLVPNLLTNVLQVWKFRRHRLGPRFLWRFAGGGAAGMLVGTAILATAPQEALQLVVAFAVGIYIAFRLMRPDWSIGGRLAEQMSLPAGAAAGLLQGASGLSAPASLTFLNAMRLERPVFIATVSIFFVAITAVQIVALGLAGILTAQSLVFSAAAVLPILAFMPLGAKLAKRLSPAVFDRVILALLALLSIKLVFDALT